MENEKYVTKKQSSWNKFGISKKGIQKTHYSFICI